MRRSQRIFAEPRSLCLCLDRFIMDLQDVVEILRRNNNKMMESALLEALNTRGRVTSAKELRDALIVLEVRGVVRIHSLDEERRLIMLLE
ncbi:MAG: hypothetical protein QXS08_06105 [Nitrososphaerota archaeon]